MKITMIGAGAMGGATVEGWVRAGVVKASDVTVADPSQAVLQRFEALGVATTTDNGKAAAEADVVCVCVKPWLVEQVLKAIDQMLHASRQLLVVIASGVKAEQIRGWLTHCPPVFLAIPNIAIAYGQSMTFLVSDHATEEQTQTVKELFDSVGQTLLTDEKHLPAGTTLASCGIAYAMRYIRAASEGGVELGFKADEAKTIVMKTLQGAVALLEASGLHPEAAIDLVTTPGGLTIRGLNEMEHAGFSSAVVKGLTINKS